MKVFMKEAYAQAEKAYDSGEVPIGAVIVRRGKVIAAAHNMRESQKDPTAHAELLAIRQACEVLGSPDLRGCDLYVTLEPCPMCMGAIILARINVLVFGCSDYSFGAAGSRYQLADHPNAKHLKIYGGIMERECAELLRDFFGDLRDIHSYD
jgi:tRNA(adenine34) deaminase